MRNLTTVITVLAITILSLGLIVGCSPKKDVIEQVEEEPIKETAVEEKAVELSFKRVRDGDIQEVEKFLEEVGDPNYRFKDYHGKNNTPLHVATIFGHTDIAQLLIDNGADVNIRNDYGMTPLFFVRDSENQFNSNEEKKGIYEVVKILIENGADVNARNNRGGTPLHSTSNSSVGIIKLLIDNGADVDAMDDEGHTTLFYYARVVYGTAEKASILINAGADLKMPANKKAFRKAACNDKTEMVKLFVMKGMPYNKNEPIIPMCSPYDETKKYLKRLGFKEFPGISFNVSSWDNRWIPNLDYTWNGPTPHLQYTCTAPDRNSEVSIVTPEEIEEDVFLAAEEWKDITNNYWSKEPEYYIPSTPFSAEELFNIIISNSKENREIISLVKKFITKIPGHKVMVKAVGDSIIHYLGTVNYNTRVYSITYSINPKTGKTRATVEGTMPAPRDKNGRFQRQNCQPLTESWEKHFGNVDQECSADNGYEAMICSDYFFSNRVYEQKSDFWKDTYRAGAKFRGRVKTLIYQFYKELGIQRKIKRPKFVDKQ